MEMVRRHYTIAGTGIETVAFEELNPAGFTKLYLLIVHMFRLEFCVHAPCGLEGTGMVFMACMLSLEPEKANKAQVH